MVTRKQPRPLTPEQQIWWDAFQSVYLADPAGPRRAPDPYCICAPVQGLRGRGSSRIQHEVSKVMSLFLLGAFAGALLMTAIYHGTERVFERRQS